MTGLLLSLLLIALTACGTSQANKAANKATHQIAQAVSVSSSQAMVKAANSRLGKILVDSRGMTLYHLIGEKNGKIVCTGSCAVIWPPLLAKAGQHPVAASGIGGTLSTVKRPDGKKQISYNGMPLYLYKLDQKPGQTLGQGVHGVWFVVHPKAKSSSSSSGYGY